MFLNLCLILGSNMVNIYYFQKLQYLSHFQNVGKLKTSLGLLRICLFKLMAQWNFSTK